MKQTEVDLLRLAITANAKTQTAFADLIFMSRQNLTVIIRDSEMSGGDLPPKFIKKLKEQAGIDIYQYRLDPNPTKDFHSKDEASKAGLMMDGNEDVYLSKKTWDYLIDENRDLKMRLKKCESALEKRVYSQ